MDSNHIYEPVNEYDKKYRDLHKKNVSDYFEDLVKTSNVNEEENKLTVKEINKTRKTIEIEEKQIRKTKNLRRFVVILIIIGFIAGAIIGYNVYEGTYMVNMGADIVIALLAIGAGVGFIFLIKKKINVTLKAAEQRHKDLSEHLQEEIKKAWAQMAPLNELFDWGMPAELCQKTVPFLSLDPYFDSKRFDILHNKFNLPNNDDQDTSIAYAQSGEIKGNPFVLGKMVNHWMGTHRYTGTLTIFWTETVSDSRGGSRTVTRTQVLTAYVTKPKPAYLGRSFLIYANEAAPDLSFSRLPNDADHLSEKEIDKKVAKGVKKINKKARKSVTKGGSFTAMGDEEFDVLFGALDRDHEVQFRLLYTPLAQRETLKIILDNKVGFGDDFEFIKKKMLNYILPEHLDKADIDTNPSKYETYDLEVTRKIFNNYNNSYFKSIYFSFAPLLAIPLYQQHKPKEYIYKDVYKSTLSSWEHEAIANSFDQRSLKHPASATFNMIKTRWLRSKEGADEVKVTAHGYEEFTEVDYIPVRGGDGRTHLVPVTWYRYEPVSKDTNMVIKTADTLKRNEYLKNVLNNEDWQKYLDKNLSLENQVGYRRNIVAYTAKPSGLTSIDELKKILDR